MITDYLNEKRQVVDRVLDANLPPPDTEPTVIHEAIRYAVLGGGKRLRPIVASAAAEAPGAPAAEQRVYIAGRRPSRPPPHVNDTLPAPLDHPLRRRPTTPHVAEAVRGRIRRRVDKLAGSLPGSIEEALVYAQTYGDVWTDDAKKLLTESLEKGEQDPDAKKNASEPTAEAPTPAAT